MISETLLRFVLFYLKNLTVADFLIIML